MRVRQLHMWRAMWMKLASPRQASSHGLTYSLTTQCHCHSSGDWWDVTRHGLLNDNVIINESMDNADSPKTPLYHAAFYERAVSYTPTPVSLRGLRLRPVPTNKLTTCTCLRLGVSVSAPSALRPPNFRSVVAPLFTIIVARFCRNKHFRL